MWLPLLKIDGDTKTRSQLLNAVKNSVSTINPIRCLIQFGEIMPWSKVA